MLVGFLVMGSQCISRQIGGLFIIKLAIAPINQYISTKLVADYWGENREWRWPEFEHLIPTKILMHIYAIKIFGD